MDDKEHKWVVKYILLTLVFPLIVALAIIDYFKKNAELFIKPLEIINEGNILLNLVIIGIVSGVLGAVGHLIGKIFEHIVSGKDTFIKRFPNDLLRVLFWVTTTIFLYLSLIHKSSTTLLSITTISIYIGSLTALICGLAYPLLNKIIFGSFSAVEQKNKMLRSIIWFFIAGLIWGVVISTLWDIFVIKEIDITSSLIIGIITATYGSISGMILQITGGLGTNDSKTNNDFLTSFITGFVFFIPIAIVLYILHGNIVFSIVALYIGGMLALTMVDNKFVSKYIFSNIRLALNKQHGAEGSAKVMMMLLLLILNAPWSALLCYGLLQFK